MPKREPLKESAPAYQWYPRHFLSDPRMLLLPLAAEGLFRRLYDYAWIENGLPAKLDDLFGISKCRSRVEFAGIWKLIAREFPKARDGRLRHVEQERQRKELAAFRKSRKAAAVARWHPKTLHAPASSSNARGLNGHARALHLESSASESVSVQVQEDQSHRRAARAGLSAEKPETENREIKRLGALASADILQPLINANRQLPTESALIAAIMQQAQQRKLPCSERTATIAARRQLKTWKPAFDHFATNAARVN